MELVAVLPYHHYKPIVLNNRLTSISIAGKRVSKRNSYVTPCCSVSSSDDAVKPVLPSLQFEGRRALFGCFLATAASISISDVAGAVSTSRIALRGEKISEDEFTTLANGLNCNTACPPNAIPVYEEDKDLLQFAVNLEYLEADFFLWGAFGYGLDKVAPELVMGGPSPIGAKKANLDNLTERIITEFGYQEIGHLRILKSTVGGFPRPLLDLSASNFAKIFDNAFDSGNKLDPPFDPYRDSLSYMLASYVVPYMGLVGYVGTNPLINGYQSKRLLAGLLGVEAGQDAVIRAYLYERANEIVRPYKYTVAEFTVRISNLRDRLAMGGIKDEGVIVPKELGAEMKTTSNVLSANRDSLSYKRTPAEILRVVYGTGDEHIPGGFFPKGAKGKIAQEYLEKP